MKNCIDTATIFLESEQTTGQKAFKTGSHVYIDGQALAQKMGGGDVSELDISTQNTRYHA